MLFKGGIENPRTYPMNDESVKELPHNNDFIMHFGSFKVSRNYIQTRS